MQLMDKSDSPETWLDEHGAYLYRFAYGKLHDTHKCEEAVQETLLAAFQARHSFAGNGTAIRTWLTGILKHKIIDMIRKDSREESSGDQHGERDENETYEHQFIEDGHWREPALDWGRPEDILSSRQFMKVLQHCIDGLPAKLARLFWLREIMEEETDTICTEMTISPNNLWTMLYRARMGLRQCLERHDLGRAPGG